jgi:hypothetical protein
MKYSTLLLSNSQNKKSRNAAKHFASNASEVLLQEYKTSWSFL